MQVLSPIPDIEASSSALAARPLSLSGQTIGILSNGKPNSLALLRAIASRLEVNCGVAGIIEADKSVEGEGAGDPSPEPVLHRLSSGAIAVLVASGD